MADIRLPGGLTIGTNSLRREADSRGWLTLGPVFDDTDRTLGAMIMGPTRGFAIYVLPRSWAVIEHHDEL